MKDYREIEKKFRVKGSFDDVLSRLLPALPDGGRLLCETVDEYWSVPGKGDFVRLRHSSGKWESGKHKVLKEVTVKQKDKGHNVDRVEVNVEVGSVEDARQLLRMTLGSSLGRIRKKEWVLFLSDGTVVSLCDIVDGDLYIEVEASSVRTVNKYMELIGGYFDGMEYEPRSLFELYVDKLQRTGS